MTLPPEFTKLSLKEARAKLYDLINEHEKLKEELSRYQKAPNLSAFLNKVLDISQDAFLKTMPDTAVLLLMLLSIWVGVRLSDCAFGKDAMFFRWIPISYFFDWFHVMVLLRFFVFLFKDIVFLIKEFGVRK
jgi:hypothetical protein